MNAIDGPLQGLSRAQSSFDGAAGRIAKSSLVSSNNPQDQVSLSDEMVAILKARADYEANLKSLETGNDMTKKLLDAIR